MVEETLKLGRSLLKFAIKDVFFLYFLKDPQHIATPQVTSAMFQTSIYLFFKFILSFYHCIVDP